ncbi:hypothetical protein B0H13DRAFT_1856479 [Mycena leptocephala]|nr:hypothetical protein B0H13DRAFT_1856479 [Mycena leptocephala]
MPVFGALWYTSILLKARIFSQSSNLTGHQKIRGGHALRTFNANIMDIFSGKTPGAESQRFSEDFRTLTFRLPPSSKTRESCYNGTPPFRTLEIVSMSALELPRVPTKYRMVSERMFQILLSTVLQNPNEQHFTTTPPTPTEHHRVSEGWSGTRPASTARQNLVWEHITVAGARIANTFWQQKALVLQGTVLQWIAPIASHDEE